MTMSNHQRHVLRAAERAERQAIEANAPAQPVIDRPPYHSPATINLGIKQFKGSQPKPADYIVRVYKQNAWSSYRQKQAEKSQKNAKPFINNLKELLAK